MRNPIAIYIAMQSRMQSMLKDEKGATMVEYALLVAFIALIAAAGANILGDGLSAQFSAIAEKIKG